MADNADDLKVPASLRNYIRKEVLSTSEQQLNDIWMVVHSLKNEGGGGGGGGGAPAEDVQALKASLEALQSKLDDSLKELETTKDELRKHDDSLERRIKGLKKRVHQSQESPGLPPQLLEGIEQQSERLVKLEALAERNSSFLNQLEEKVEEALERFEELGQLRESLKALEGRLDLLEERPAVVVGPSGAVAADAPGATSFFDISDEGLAALPTELSFRLEDLVKVVLKHNAHDLYLKNNALPMANLGGDLVPIGKQFLTAEDCRRLILLALPLDKRRQLLAQEEVEHSCIVHGTRFRASVFLERSGVCAAFRRLASVVPNLEELGLPREVELLAMEERGLIIITGGADSGKSSTLAALVDNINSHRKARVIIIEDPIEFEHQDNRSYITQREVGTDTRGFPEAVRHAVRQHPQMLVLSDVPESSSARLALKAADSGVLVVVGLAADSVIDALEKLSGLFPKEEQLAFQRLLADSLVAVVGQRLVPRLDGEGNVVATELLVNTPGTRTYLQDGMYGLIEPLLERGDQGMRTFKQSLAELAANGIISQDLVPAGSTQPASPGKLQERPRLNKPAEAGDLLPPPTLSPPPPSGPPQPQPPGPPGPPGPPPQVSLAPPQRISVGGPPSGPPPGPPQPSLGPPQGPPPNLQPVGPPQAQPQGPPTRPAQPPPPVVQQPLPPPVPVPEAKPEKKEEGGDDALLGWL